MEKVILPEEVVRRLHVSLAPNLLIPLSVETRISAGPRFLSGISRPPVGSMPTLINNLLLETLSAVKNLIFSRNLKYEHTRTQNYLHKPLHHLKF